MKKLICCKCNIEINQKEDRWVNIRDFNKGKEDGEKDLHLKCWKELSRRSIQKAFNEKARQISPMLKNLMGNFGGLTQNA
jgi:hypothetical protein